MKDPLNLITETANAPQDPLNLIKPAEVPTTDPLNIIKSEAPAAAPEVSAAMPEVAESPSLAKQIFELPKTAGEMGLSLVTGVPAWLASSAGKVGAGFYEDITGKETDVGEKIEEEVGKAVWQPETPWGQRGMETIGKGMEIATEPIREAAEMVGESWDSKGMEALAQFGGELAAFHYGGKAFKGAKNIAKEVITSRKAAAPSSLEPVAPLKLEGEVVPEKSKIDVLSEEVTDTRQPTEAVKEPVAEGMPTVEEVAEAPATVQTSPKAVWDKLDEQFPSVHKGVGLYKSTKRIIKDILSDPQDRMSKDPYAKQIFTGLLNAEESGNSFLYRHLKGYDEATKGMKKGGEKSIKVGQALDGKISLDKLNPKERKAYDFFKKDFEFLINEAAHRAAGSEEAFQRVLRAVKAEKPKTGKLAELSPEEMTEYTQLKEAASRIRGKRKVAALEGEEKTQYAALQKEMSNLRNKSYVDKLPEGEQEAYRILSSKISNYLPHLFDPKELLEAFRIDLATAQEKLRTATNKSSRTKYRKRVVNLEQSIAKLEGGKLITFEQLPKDIFFRFFSPRKGKAGYSFDAMKAYETYLYGITRKMFDEPALKRTKQLFDNVDPELKPYTKDLVRHYMGYDKHIGDNLANAITTFEWIRTLGFNPRSAVVNLSQRINTVAYAGEKYAAKAEKMMLTDKEVANKLFDETGIAREVPAVLTEGPTSVGMKTVNDMARAMFNYVELGNRKHAFLAGYLKGKDVGTKRGMAGDALEAFAKKEGVKTVHETQFRYGKLGMPKLYWNPTARVAFQFTSYPLKQARFLYRLWKKDKVAFLKYVAYAEGINYTLQELLDADMSNALGFGVTWGEALKTVFELAEGDTKGALRHAKQTVNLGGGLLPSGFGPTVSGALAIADAADQGKGIEQLKKELTPVMVRRLAQTYKGIKHGAQGEYPIYDDKGHLIYSATGRQLLQRTVGPRPAEELHRSQDIEARRNLEQEMAEVMFAITEAFIEGDVDKVADLVTKYGIMPTDKMIENEIKRRELTEEERKEFGKEEMYQMMREGRTY